MSGLFPAGVVEAIRAQKRWARISRESRSPGRARISECDTIADVSLGLVGS